MCSKETHSWMFHLVDSLRKYKCANVFNTNVASLQLAYCQFGHIRQRPTVEASARDRPLPATQRGF
jgi:hypothetical protein